MNIIPNTPNTLRVALALTMAGTVLAGCESGATNNPEQNDHLGNYVCSGWQEVPGVDAEALLANGVEVPGATSTAPEAVASPNRAIVSFDDPGEKGLAGIAFSDPGGNIHAALVGGGARTEGGKMQLNLGVGQEPLRVVGVVITDENGVPKLEPLPTSLVGTYTINADSPETSKYENVASC